MFPLSHLIVVVGAEERQAEYQGAEQHVEVVKGEKEADEDSEIMKSDIVALSVFSDLSILYICLRYIHFFLFLTKLSLCKKKVSRRVKLC